MFPRAREALMSDWRWRLAEVALGILVFFVALQLTGLVDVARLIKDYQVLIGILLGVGATGGLGFWGVIMTLRGNAETALAQREQEIEQERTGARAMILAELMVMHDGLSRMDQVCMEGRRGNTYEEPKYLGRDELEQVDG